MRRPAPALAPYVERYWLSRHNADEMHVVRPDGRVDVVLEVADDHHWRGWAYGATSRITPVACIPGRHYLGIRFRPGRSRHFLAAGADTLTDRREDAHGLVRFALAPIAEQAASGNPFQALDRVLVASLAAAPPADALADHAVALIESAHGALRMETLSERLGVNPRRLQRAFAGTVGVPAKAFAAVVRARRAVRLIGGGLALAEAAAATGYADQSHMTRELVRLTGATPADARGVGFVQDGTGDDDEH